MISLKRISSLAALLITLVVACQGKPSSEPFSISTATPGGKAPAAGTGATPEAQEDYVISAMPHCRGLTDLRATVVFDWPNIEEALEKLAEYNWGYYTCDLRQPELQAFLRDNMGKPPHLWREVNRASHKDGQVTLHYQPFAVVFMYIWTLPKPDTGNSYMIIARGDPGEAQTWECRLPRPTIAPRAILTLPGRKCIP